VWQSAASALRAKLLKALGPEQCSELHIVGRSRKQKVMLDAEHLTECMEVAGRTYDYMQVSPGRQGRGLGQLFYEVHANPEEVETGQQTGALPADWNLLCCYGRRLVPRQLPGHLVCTT
jgi:hypothetical protein